MADCFIIRKSSGVGDSSGSLTTDYLLELKNLYTDDEILVDLYSYEEQTLQVSCNNENFVSTDEITLSKGLNSSLNIGKITAGGNYDIHLLSSSGVIFLLHTISCIFNNYNFIAENASELLFIFNNRKVTKKNDGKIYCAYCWTSDGWFNPIVVGLTDESTTCIYYNEEEYSALSPDAASLGGTFEAYGKTWYYNCSKGGSYTRVYDSSGLNRYFIGQLTIAKPDEEVARQVLQLCERDFL